MGAIQENKEVRAQDLLEGCQGRSSSSSSIVVDAVVEIGAGSS